MKTNSIYCHYTNYWYCSNCISREKAIIPWYVIEKWDFSKYTVCKLAKDELDMLYNKHIIFIEIQSDLVKRNIILYKTLVRIHTILV